MHTLVSELMTRDVEVIAPEDSLQHAAQLMDELNVGALPVCRGKKLVGIITDRDITVRATAVGCVPTETAVSDVMTEAVRWCFERENTASVMQRMAETQIRRIPVLNDAHELVGIVSLGDLAARLDEPTERTLRAISLPSAPDR